ncbi:transcriptional regulator [Sphaerisporangium rufum]|uniref:Transcriptional regulator n=1 Tax=Sphaerisporangium rufum TaxID=1381558 RepID=A0A919R4N9_9ACTN|nr:helix-turn-helix transcriptional regulator [Sphaerisporangium rufum]GII79233.1 transcriptional regulator [Sphaerisporangium rufum]
MAGKRGMTLRAQWLGRQLRELREAAGLTLTEAGKFIQRDGGTISRLETGLYPARTPDVAALLNLYGVSDEQRREGLLRLAADVWQIGWWDSYSGSLSRKIVDYAWLESRARHISSFDALVVPGLLQTSGYIEAVIRRADADLMLEQVASGVRFRVERQKVLDKPEPLSLECVLDESLLYRATGGPQILSEQLDHLLLLVQRPNIQVRVLPYSAGAHVSPEGAFMIFELPEPYPEVAFMDTPAGGIYVEADEVERLKSKLRRIRQLSLGPAESIGMIRAAAERVLGSQEAMNSGNT